MSDHQEVILAQEQGTTMRQGGRAKEVEAEFGFNETEGTLVLTNRRLIFVCTDEKKDDLMGEDALNPKAGIHIVYSEVDDLGDIPTDSPNAFVAIAAIESVKGHSGGIGRPSLEVEWNDGGRRALVFTEGVTKSRGKGLNDWAPVIEKLKAGSLELVALPRQPSTDTLEGKIARVLSDMQEREVLTIEEAVEAEFKLDLDPDEVQAACDSLASTGFVKRRPDPTGVFYRKASPLGEEDLSS